MNTKKIIYRFEFSDQSVQYPVSLERRTLSSITYDDEENLPDWTLLVHKQCSHCPFTTNQRMHCPIAVALCRLMEAFGQVDFNQKADMTVIAEERSYYRHDRAEIGFGSLIGLVMVTAGCPHLDKLRPMAYTHLPFARFEETLYRAVSMYLTSRYFLSRRGIDAPSDLTGLLAVYADVNRVNTTIPQRIRNLPDGGANMDAIAGLDGIAGAVALSIAGDWWDPIDHFFHTYEMDER